MSIGQRLSHPQLCCVSSVLIDYLPSPSSSATRYQSNRPHLSMFFDDLFCLSLFLSPSPQVLNVELSCTPREKARQFHRMLRQGKSKYPSPWSQRLPQSNQPSIPFPVRRLALYVYEYLLHVGAQKAAQTFLSEVSALEPIRRRESMLIVPVTWR